MPVMRKEEKRQTTGQEQQPDDTPSVQSDIQRAGDAHSASKREGGFL